MAQVGQTKANLSLTLDAPNPSLRDRIQAAALRVGIRVSRALGPATASNLGGHVARTIGPWLPVSRIARANLSRALPELDARARRRVLLGVWENLGRTAAEMPHVGALRRTADGPGWECEDDTVLRALRDHGGPAILFSGHLANWEIGLPVAASLGLTVSWFYRAASNPAADAAIQDMRRGATGAEVPMFAKGSAGAREALAHLRRGGVLGMLVDQKLNEGVAVPFFGRPAMTTPALAQFALRFRCPVIPVYSVRLGPARFRVICGTASSARLRMGFRRAGRVADWVSASSRRPPGLVAGGRRAGLRPSRRRGAAARR